MHSNDDDARRLFSTPDSYRDRAQSAAGLIATAAAVIAAGSVLGDPAQFRAWSGFFAIAALIFLLASLVCYLSAAQFRRVDDVLPSEFEKAVREITREIHRRMKVGGVLGFLAVVAFLGLVIFAVWQPGQETLVRVSVGDSLNRTILGGCSFPPEGDIEGYVSETDLSDTAQFLRVRLAEEECRDVVLFVPTGDVRMVVELDD